MRKDFVSGVLSEEELGQQLFVHELHRDYAASVLNFRSYDAISRDVLQVCESFMLPEPAIAADACGSGQHFSMIRRMALTGN